MSNGKKQDKAANDLERGLAILSKQDWFDLQIFALTSIHRNPTTVKRMAVALGMPDEKDPHWDADFTQTANDYNDLATYCDQFWNTTRPEMVNLADDVVQYQAKMDSFFKRLIGTIDDYDVAGDKSVPVQNKLDALWKDWGLTAPSSDALKVKDRFITAVSRLQEDAEGRCNRAGELLRQVNSLHDNLIKSEAIFQRNTQNYETKYGTESEAMKNLQLRYDNLKIEVESNQTKEKDAVIVLASSPVYLILWPFGPLIMAGVQIGVGAHLADLRNKINKLVADVADALKELNVKQKFSSNYNIIKKYTKRTADEINAILPAVASLKDGWNTIALDLKGIVGLLKGGHTETSKEDWFALGSSLEATRERWKFLAARADRFRLNATVREVPSVEELFKDAEKAAAA